MEANFTVFAGKAATADSTILPTSRSWLKSMAQEHSGSVDEYQVVLWLNCTTVGILSAHQKAYMYSYVSNVLADFPLNGICFCIYPNRAGQNQDFNRTSKMTKSQIHKVSIHHHLHHHHYHHSQQFLE